MVRFLGSLAASLGMVLVLSASASAQPAPYQPQYAPQPSSYDAEVRVEIAPPAPQLEVQSVAPSRQHVWIPGHWAWRMGRYVWVPGFWDLARVGQVWVRAHWVRVGVFSGSLGAGSPARSVGWSATAKFRDCAAGAAVPDGRGRADAAIDAPSVGRWSLVVEWCALGVDARSLRDASPRLGLGA